MNFTCTTSIFPTLNSPFLNPNFKSLIHLTSTPILILPPNHPNPKPILSLYTKFPNSNWAAKKRNFHIKASIDANNCEPRNWVSWLPKGSLAADKVLRLISSATSSPICQFISSPTTFLHSVDPRIKLVKISIFYLLFFFPLK